MCGDYSYYCWNDGSFYCHFTLQCFVFLILRCCWVTAFVSAWMTDGRMRRESDVMSKGLNIETEPWTARSISNTLLAITAMIDWLVILCGCTVFISTWIQLSSRCHRDECKVFLLIPWWHHQSCGLNCFPWRPCLDYDSLKIPALIPQGRFNSRYLIVVYTQSCTHTQLCTHASFKEPGQGGSGEWIIRLHHQHKSLISCTFSVSAYDHRDQWHQKGWR